MYKPAHFAHDMVPLDVIDAAERNHPERNSKSFKKESRKLRNNWTNFVAKYGEEKARAISSLLDKGDCEYDIIDGKPAIVCHKRTTIAKLYELAKYAVEASIAVYLETLPVTVHGTALLINADITRLPTKWEPHPTAKHRNYMVCPTDEKWSAVRVSSVGILAVLCNGGKINLEAMQEV